MRPVVCVAVVLALAGCRDTAAPPPETPATEAVPATAGDTSSPDGTMGPPPPPDAMPSTSTAELEAAIRATAPDYSSSVGDEDTGKARYVAARKDLDGDGVDELFVYLMGPYFCGSGGCNLLIFDQGMDGNTLLANIPTSRPPVIVADTKTNGHADVWRLQSGGGAPAEYVRHVFRDGRYVEASRTPAAQVPTGTTVLADDTDFSDGAVLEPGANEPDAPETKE